MTRSSASGTSSSAASTARWIRPFLASLSVGFALWILVRGHDGYDLAYALLWGDQLFHGQLPAFASAYAPTPHPLANLVGLLVAPLGRPAGGEAFRLLICISLGATAVGAFQVGRRLFGTPAGVLAAVVLVTRPALVASALRGSIDIPALALTLFALDALLATRMTTALALLAFAGLLRPEAWLLSFAVALWWRRPAASRSRVSAPVLWCLADLIVTGDPLFSFHGTRALAEELGRPRSAPLAPLLVPRLITAAIGLPVLLAGAIGLATLAERAKAVLAVLVLALATFVLIGAAGLPLLARYLLPAAALLAILAAGAVTTPGPRWVRVAAAVCLLAAIPATVSGIADAVRDSRTRRAVQADLRNLRLACGPLSTVTYRAVPLIAYAHQLAPAAIAPTPNEHAIILPRSARAAESLQSAADTAPLLLAPPPGFALGAQSRDWALACGSRP